MIDFDDLERKAKAAGREPWDTNPGDIVFDDDNSIVADLSRSTVENWEFVRSMRPSVVLELIAEVKRMREAAAHVVERAAHYAEPCAHHEATEALARVLKGEAAACQCLSCTDPEYRKMFGPKGV